MTEQILTIEKPTAPSPTAMRWKRWQVDALLIFCTAIWGGTFLIVQNSIKSIGPFFYVSLRFTIATLTIAILFWSHLRRITRAELLQGFIIGLFLCGGYIFQTTGLQYTTSSKAGFITGLNVVIVPILSIAILKQWPGLGGTIGVILATIGMTLLSMGNQFDLYIGMGEILIFFCAVCFAWQIITISRFAPSKDAYNLTVVQLATTAIISGICAPFFGEQIVMPGAEVWWSVLFMGVIATAFTFAVMNRVQQFTSSTRAALIYALEPVFAGLFGYLAGETLSLPAWLGCALIFLGMISTEVKFKQRRQVDKEIPEEQLVA